MITKDGLKSVNERIQKIPIKGKEYACVPSRISAFRELCPNGSIETEILSLEDGVVIMKATVKDENGKILATGMAQEKEASSYINKTSFIENAETSAVGRALGMIGIGSDQQIASAEELVNALNNQQNGQKQTPENTPISKSQLIQLRAMCVTHALPEDHIYKPVGKNSLEEMTEKDLNWWTPKMKQMLAAWDKEHKETAA